MNIGDSMLSEEAQEFLSKNGTTYEDLRTKVSTRLYSLQDNDSIIFDYLISLDREPKNISIADIVGYDYTFANTITTSDIFKSFPNFFQKNGDSYHTRANGMLEYTSDNMIQKLLRSFKEEPIKLVGATKGKYVIDVNGLHRYTLLRSLYLIELSKLGDNQEEIEKLNAKYTIPVEASEIDFIKTYSHYILSMLGIVRYVSKEFNDNYKATGRAKVEFSNKDKMIMTNAELLELVTKTLTENKDKWIYFSIYLDRSDEFKTFITMVCPEMLIPQQNEIGGNAWKI